ncbi:hypothetical protein B0T19DRAFT_447931 [Cercophora scortea]|uniref:DUF7924 domain-containing protein n=1 Tax=Cercophora scortea TaxID=314031 RepID=A0AAE0J5J1_9PEZI|nr:hypothetical protein B0T19DRAFT_447931 [Cercophora scortea]
MDEASKTQANSQESQPELSQAELPPTQAEQVPANSQTRKRQLDSDDNAELRTKPARTTRLTSKPARLTRKNLAEFNKMGKKKTSDPTDDSRSTKTTSTTTSSFAVKAQKNGILDPRSSKPPTNLEEIREQYARPCATASPPQSVYKSYTSRVRKAKNKATMVVITSGHLLKEYDDDEGYDRVFNQQFTGLPRNLGFNNGLSAPQPDFVEGLEMGKYLPFPVDEHIPGAALYQDDPHSLTLPHIAGEWKGPDGSMKKAELQSAYNGAALVYGRNQALAYIKKSDPPGHAKITTFTTDGTNLNLYAHYATPSAEDGNTLEYHQYPISSANLTSTHQSYKDGRKTSLETKPQSTPTSRRRKSPT